jgi:iron complex outermembrane receptor protein
MNSTPGSRGKHTGLLAGAVAILMAITAYAQNLTFDIAAGDLQTALDAYIKQTGQQILYRNDDLKGKQSNGAKGDMSAEQALQAILAGTNLQMRRDESGAVVLFPAEAAAVAASTGKAGGNQLEEVVVRATAISQLSLETRTATRLDTDPMLVPMSISTVQEDLLRQQQAGTVSDVMANVSGVITSPSGLASARGFAVTSSRNGQAYVGQIGASQNLTFRPVVATERVEVVKGPEQIMQGKDSGIGGVANVVTKIPTPDDYLFVGGAVGSDSYWRLDVDANGTLIDGPYGRLMGEVIGSIAEQGDGPFDTIGPSQDFYSGALRWTNNDFGSDVSLAYEYSSTERGASLLALGPEYIPNGAPEYLLGDSRSYLSSKSDLVELHYRQRITGAWYADLAYTWREEHMGNSNFATFGDFFTFDPEVILGLQFASPDYTSQSDAYRVSVHGQFETGPLAHRLLLGYDYQSHDNTNANFSILGTYYNNIPQETQTFEPCVDFCEQDPSRTTEDQTGILLTDQISWQKWHVLLGVRWVSSEQKSWSGDPPVLSYELDEDATLPQAGVVYAATPRLSFYASGNEGFRSNALLQDIDGNTLPNTTFTQVEGGVKYLLLDEQLALTAALYQVKEKDVPEFAGYDEDFNVYYVSIPGITTKGVEIELAGQPIRGLQMRATYAYLDVSVDATGEPPLGGYVPNRFTFWSQYWLSRNPGQGWWAGGGLVTTDSPERRAEFGDWSGNTVVDLSAGYQNGHWQAILGLKNVADVKGYYPYAGGAPILFSPYFSANRIPGQELRFDLNYRF